MSTLRVNAIESLSSGPVIVDVIDSIKTVESISELLDLPGTTDYLVRAKGYYANTVAGGGLFRFNSSRIAENDFGTILLGWERILETEPLTPEMFGSTNSGDQQTYFIRMRDAIENYNGGSISFQKNKSYIVSGAVTFNTGNITVTGNGASIHSTNTTRTDIFQFFGNADNDRITDIHITGPLTLTSTYWPGAIPTGSGINLKWVDSATVSKCRITNFSDTGVNLTDCDNVHITENYIKDCVQPINVFNHSSHCVIRDNKIYNATVYVGINIEGFALIPASIYQPDDIIVEGNTVTGFVTQGIDFQNVLRGKCIGNTITGGTGTTNSHGIHLFGSPRVHCTDNISHDNAGWGIRCGPGCTAAIIADNTTFNNAIGSLRHDDGPAVATCHAVRLGQNAFIEGPPVQSGNVSFSGLYFGNNAVADSKALDWYEEFYPATATTFTPVAAGTTSAGAGTYTIQSGRLTRIGNVCIFTIDLGWSAHTGTGNLIISGLPFNSTAITTSVSIHNNGLAVTPSNVLQAYINANSDDIIITQYNPSGGVISSILMDSAVAEISISGIMII